MLNTFYCEISSNKCSTISEWDVWREKNVNMIHIMNKPTSRGFRDILNIDYVDVMFDLK